VMNSRCRRSSRAAVDSVAREIAGGLWAEAEAERTDGGRKICTRTGRVRQTHLQLLLNHYDMVHHLSQNNGGVKIITVKIVAHIK
jgi:hypothetical protein